MCIENNNSFQNKKPAEFPAGFLLKIFPVIVLAVYLNSVMEPLKVLSEWLFSQTNLPV